MRTLRARLAVIAVSLLLLQAGATAVSTFNVCCADARQAAQTMQCCRDGGTDHICPLMKGGTTESPRCRMRACDTGQDHVLPLGGLIGVLVPPTPFVLEAAAVPAHDFLASPVRRSSIPPSPPPRG